MGRILGTQTSTISFFAVNKTEPQTRKLGSTTLQQPRLVVRAIQIRFGIADDSKDWWIKVEMLCEVFLGTDGVRVRSPFRVLLTREKEHEAGKQWSLHKGG